MLGYDVFQVANEGKMIAVVPAEQAQAALEAMKSAPYGENAAIVGEVSDEPAGRVYVKTSFGAKRIMDMLVGEQLPRIPRRAQTRERRFVVEDASEPCEHPQVIARALGRTQQQEEQVDRLCIEGGEVESTVCAADHDDGSLETR